MLKTMSSTLVFLGFLSLHGSFNTVKIIQDAACHDTKGYNLNDPRINGEYHIAKHIIDNKSIVFDIGANWGDWSRFVVSLNKNILLYAFDPIPSNFALLQHNFVQPNIHLYNIALDNCRTIKDFFVYENPISKENAGSSLHDRPGLAQYKKIIQVQTNTLDDFCQEHTISHIDFMKIDTEGNEFFILQGGQTLLANHAIAFIQFEYGGTYPDAGVTLEQVYHLLTSYRYSVYRILPDGLLKINSWRPELENNQYSNYLAVAHQ